MNIQFVLDSLIESYNTIEALQARLAKIEANKPKPMPTKAIQSLVSNMTTKPVRDSIIHWKRMFNAATGIDRVILWKNGMVTTFGENPSVANPLAIFTNRQTAILRLRKAGWNVPTCVNERGTAFSAEYIIATRR